MTEDEDEDFPTRPETIRPHATLDCAYPASEDTFTGRMMLRIAGGAWEDTDDLAEEFEELAEEFEEFFPDDDPVAPAAVPELLERVTAEYRRVVPETSYDALVFAGVLPGLLLPQGIVFSWGDGFDSSEALEYVAELAQEGKRQGLSIRGYAYAHTQDLDRMVLTGRLYLGFGVFGPRDDAGAEAVGAVLAEILRATKLPVEWDGSADGRIVCDPVLFELSLDEESDVESDED